MAPEALSPADQARVDAGKANAAREKEALKNTGPVVKTYNAETGKTTVAAVKVESERTGEIGAEDTESKPEPAKS